MLVNAMDYDTIELALQAAQNGDRLYFPSKVWVVPVGGLVITRNIELFGDGASNPGDDFGTTFVPADNNSDVIVFAPEPGVELQSVYLHDFKVRDRFVDPNLIRGR